MAECAFCRAETQLYDSGSPICVACADARESKRKPPRSTPQILNVLQADLQAAVDRAKAAEQAYDAVNRAASSGLPQPDGAQRLQNASREVSLARVELMMAHSQINEFLSRGIVPDRLKQSCGR
jgi:hypothetical protein